MDLENLILENLICNDVYSRKVIPFLTEDYFKKQSHKLTFDLIKTYFDKYNTFPAKEALKIELSAVKDITQETFDECTSLVGSFSTPVEDANWLVDKTEDWCQNKALENALREALKLADATNDKGKLTKGAIPQILSDALAVSFDTTIGHDFLDDAGERWLYYHQKEKKTPFDIDLLNKITNGGIFSKTLNMLMAGIGVGKSMAMCHFAAFDLMQGLNVLYITLELKKEEVARRIDANLLDVSVNEVATMLPTMYYNKMDKLRATTKGKLIIKEYPTSSANANHFRYLLNEIKTKKGIKIDIVYIDYINLCVSSRLKMGGSVGSYTYIKMIAEEVRGLAMEFDIPIWSATQVNRSGYSDSDFGMEHVSESWGLPATCDLFIAMISTEELEKTNQIMFKQLKNRYGDPNYYNKFMVGVNRAKMRLYNLEQVAQDTIIKNTIEPIKTSDKIVAQAQRSKFEDFII